MFDPIFHAEVKACKASFDTTTVYADGGVDVVHGLSEDSHDCTCGHKRHYCGTLGYYRSLNDDDDTSAR